jgi:hypothetical protein
LNNEKFLLAYAKKHEIPEELAIKFRNDIENSLEFNVMVVKGTILSIFSPMFLPIIKKLNKIIK